KILEAMMSALFDRLLKSLPTYLDKEPGAEPGITLNYDGDAAEVTIERHLFTVKVSGGSGTSLSRQLQGLTLAQLAASLNLQPGHTAAVVAPDSSLPAISLIEVQAQDIMLAPRLDRFTSLLWALFLPVCWGFLDTVDNLNNGLLQMSVKTAEQKWVDYWGEEFYGGIRRLFHEADRAYADRIIKEVLRWRLNNLAIAQILEEEIPGITVEVINLH